MSGPETAFPQGFWWRALYDQASGPVAVLDLQGRYLYVNPALCVLLGYEQHELLRRGPRDVTHHEDPAHEEIISDILTGRSDGVFQKRYVRSDGSVVWVLLVGSIIRDEDGRPQFFLSQIFDITARAHLALHDPLTGLPNRALFLDRLDRELAQLPRRGGILAVLVADLDMLKPTNDRYGHTVGDQLIVAAAEQLVNAARDGDTVARIGGDEFVVLSNATAFSDAEGIRHRIEKCLQTEVVISNHPLCLSASVGLAVTEDPRTSTQTLLDAADRDMYARKKRARE